MLITVFSAMRPFVGSIGQVQLSAIRSWLSLGPECQVVLIDDEEGTTPQAVAELDVEIIKDVKRSRLGAPLLDDLLRVGADAARFDLLAFNTADVLLPPNFTNVALAVQRLMDGHEFFASGSRFDLLEPFEFERQRLSGVNRPRDRLMNRARLKRAVRPFTQRDTHDVVSDIVSLNGQRCLKGRHDHFISDTEIEFERK